MLNVKHSMNIFLNTCLVAGKLNCFDIEKVKKNRWQHKYMYIVCWFMFKTHLPIEKLK